MEVRLQKFIADCGVMSRRKAEEMIMQGKVRVNGKVASIGEKVDPSRDKVTVGSKKVIAAQARKNYYYMLNKPRGYITTMSDEQGRKCVAELVSDIDARVFPVGRLDRESEGLLIMTNDGEFANYISHPRSHVSKTYRVTVRGRIEDEVITKLQTGIMLDGQKTLPCDIMIISRAPERSVLQITLYEGRNRQIRRMCEDCSLEVMRLKRIMIGKVKMGMLKIGDWRELTADEVRSLTAAATATAAKGEKQ